LIISHYYFLNYSFSNLVFSSEEIYQFDFHVSDGASQFSGKIHLTSGP
jgi:hypothetical protein